MQVRGVWRYYAGSGGLVAAILCLFIGLPTQPPASAQAIWPARAEITVSPSSGYVGSAACASCHASIYSDYEKTAMGRSVVPANAPFFSRLSLPAHFTNAAIDRHFDVFTKDEKLYLSEYAIAPDSSVIFREMRPVRWLIGAGMNGYAPVVEQDQYLFQAPLSFYTKPGMWGPSPGYESLDLGFNRPILAGCISCHTGRANPVPGTNGKYQDPPFSEASIGCEDCHGPGAAHIHAMQSGATGKPQIVNPARLTPYLADNICMACHQTGDVRVLQPGKSYNDIRPGRPLDDVLAIFLVPPTRESPPDADHVEHYYSMILSKCYRSSKGRMSCLSCHDPHIQPTPSEAPAYYARKCLACHTNDSCKLPLATRMRQTPANNCIGCHMPKRDIQVISHSTATNHRIVARGDEPFPEVTFQQTTAALPDLIDLDPAPGQENQAPGPLTLLQAYGELAASHPEYKVRYLDLLQKLETSMTDNALVQAAVGRRDLQSGDYSSATKHLLRAVALAPPEATTCGDLAAALAHEGHEQDAVSWLEKSIQLDPFNPFTQRSLIVQLIHLKDYARARAALEHYVQVFPQDAFMRQMLAEALRLPAQ